MPLYNPPAAGGGAASPLVLTASGAAELPLKLVAAPSQSANLFEVRLSDDTLVAVITKDGRLAVGSAAATGSPSVGLTVGGSLMFEASGDNTPDYSMFKFNSNEVLAWIGGANGFRWYSNGAASIDMEIDVDGYLVRRGIGAIIPDGSLANGEFAVSIDFDTPLFEIKAKKPDGTVLTGSVSLS